MRKNTSVKWEFEKGRQPENKLAAVQSVSKKNIILAEEPVATPGHIQQLLDNIPGVVVEYESRNDGTHHYRYISNAIEKIFGVEASHIFKITQYIHPDDLHVLNHFEKMKSVE